MATERSQEHLLQQANKMRAASGEPVGALEPMELPEPPEGHDPDGGWGGRLGGPNGAVLFFGPTTWQTPNGPHESECADEVDRLLAALCEVQ
jgi:hypothetical protein